jgi:hypothetical protein
MPSVKRRPTSLISVKVERRPGQIKRIGAEKKIAAA